MFKSKYDGVRRRYFSNAGSPYRKEYGPQLDKYGNKVIVEKGKIDFQAYINSWRDDCDLNILMARFTAGDKESLIQRVGMFADVSKLPTNFNDMMNLTMQAEDIFNSLPVSAKEAFGNNVNNFLSNAGSSEWVELLSQSPDDFRKAIVQRSNEYMKNMKESIRRQENVNPVEEKMISDDSSVLEDVKKMFGGKLNEQKQ